MSLDPNLNYYPSDPLKICLAEDNYMFRDQAFQQVPSVSELGKLYCTTLTLSNLELRCFHPVTNLCALGECFSVCLNYLSTCLNYLYIHLIKAVFLPPVHLLKAVSRNSTRKMGIQFFKKRVKYGLTYLDTFKEAEIHFC